MDLSAVKILLESQERAFKTAMDTIVKQMNDQISKLEAEVSDLTTSLEFTQHEVDELKANAREQNKEKNEDKAAIEKLVKKAKDLEEKVIYQEDYSRRKNLRISGLEERVNETWEQTSAAVASLLESKLQLPGVVLERAHRVGPRSDAKPRTVVARFTRYGDRDAAIRRGSYLKGTNIFLNEDLSAASQAIKKAQMPLFKQARAEGKIAFFRHTKLIIREKTDNTSAGRRQPLPKEEGAVGGARDGSLDGAGHDVGGVVTGTQVAGAWSSGGGGDDARSTLPTLHAPRSRPQSPATPTTLHQRKPNYNLRTATKK